MFYKKECSHSVDNSINRKFNQQNLFLETIEALGAWTCAKITLQQGAIVFSSAL